MVWRGSPDPAGSSSRCFSHLGSPFQLSSPFDQILKEKINSSYSRNHQIPYCFYDWGVLHFIEGLKSRAAMDDPISHFKLPAWQRLDDKVSKRSITCTDPSQHSEQSRQRRWWTGTSRSPCCRETKGSCRDRQGSLGRLCRIGPQGRLCSSYHSHGCFPTDKEIDISHLIRKTLPGYSRGKQDFRESKIWVHPSLCTCECGRASGSCNWCPMVRVFGWLMLLWNVPKCISNFVTGITGCRGEEPPKSK